VKSLVGRVMICRWKWNRRCLVCRQGFDSGEDLIFN
jgi:hypothetical protein